MLGNQMWSSMIWNTGNLLRASSWSFNVWLLKQVLILRLLLRPREINRIFVRYVFILSPLFIHTRINPLFPTLEYLISTISSSLLMNAILTIGSIPSWWCIASNFAHCVHKADNGHFSGSKSPSAFKEHCVTHYEAWTPCWAISCQYGWCFTKV